MFMPDLSAASALKAKDEPPADPTRHAPNHSCEVRTVQPRLTADAYTEHQRACTNARQNSRVKSTLTKSVCSRSKPLRMRSASKVRNSRTPSQCRLTPMQKSVKFCSAIAHGSPSKDSPAQPFSPAHAQPAHPSQLTVNATCCTSATSASDGSCLLACSTLMYAPSASHCSS